MTAKNKTLLTFKRFNDIALATAVADRLKEADIPFELEDGSHLFDPSFSYNTVSQDISICLHPDDFTRATTALGNIYREELEDIEEDYYLFSFTDEELAEIISKPDEWGDFDYQLAQKLLHERGKAVDPAMLEQIKTERMQVLSKPESVKPLWIYVGYFFAIFGSPIGLIIGCTLSYLKKTLPNGERVPSFTESDRDHGTRMLVFAGCSLFLAIIIRWVFINQW